LPDVYPVRGGACRALGQARRLAREVLFLHQGRLLEQTAATEFFAQPRYREGTAFLRGNLVL
jgi:tungstate transport system ATP-binding protein